MAGRTAPLMEADMPIIVASAFSNLRKLRPERSIRGHDAFLDAMDGPGTADVFRRIIGQSRRELAESPNRGYTPDKSLRLVAKIPDRIFFHHDMQHQGCWNDEAWVKEFLEDCPDFLVNPNTRTAKGLKAPGRVR